MRSSKLLSSKIKDSSAPKTKNHASTHLKVEHSFDLTSDSNLQNKGLAVAQKKNNSSSQENQLSKQPTPANIKKSLEIFTTNKIYNAKNTSKHYDDFNKSTTIGLHRLPQEVEDKLNSRNNNQLDERPQTSNPEKYPLSFQGHRLSNEKMRPQLRPGSSKSSRLFKKKTTLVEDRIESQNDEFDDFPIKINSRQNKNENNPSLRDRQRIGTSISKKTRGFDKFETKLDPLFFNLFAS